MTTRISHKTGIVRFTLGCLNSGFSKLSSMIAATRMQKELQRWKIWRKTNNA